MLDDTQKDALRRWYRRPEILDEARKRIQREYWEDLEELIHMKSLMPLARTRELPDSMKTDEGEAMLPSLDPRANLEAWRDAIEVGWEVIESELGVTRDEVHASIGKQQKDDWASFMKSVDERKRERGEKA